MLKALRFRARFIRTLSIIQSAYMANGRGQIRKVSVKNNTRHIRFYEVLLGKQKYHSLHEKSGDCCVDHTIGNDSENHFTTSLDFQPVGGKNCFSFHFM